MFENFVFIFLSATTRYPKPKSVLIKKFIIKKNGYNRILFEYKKENLGSASVLIPDFLVFSLTEIP